MYYIELFPHNKYLILFIYLKNSETRPVRKKGKPADDK